MSGWFGVLSGGGPVVLPPDRAKIKIPLTRQDIRRITAKMGIPMNPPPITTDPTIAGAASLLAQEKGLLREWIVEVMRAEWANGLDIGDEQVLCDVGESIGLEKEALQAAFTNPEYLQQMDDNWAEAQALGLIGVPSFQIDEEQFWGADPYRIRAGSLAEPAPA